MRLTEALRSLGSRPRRLPAPVGPVSVTDGGSALRIVESMLSSRTPDTASGSTPRETLAGALGLAFTGVRTAVHLDGAELLRGQDLWTRACGAHLPLVVHLECRAPETHAASAGSGHEAIHAAEDGVVLVARNVQEAIDLTLLAHRISESALVPALVACDGPETYRALQDVRLPEPHVTKTFVGGPADRIPAPTPAQELLFGTARRRVPRWYDLDRPAALGGEQDAQGWALGAAGNRPFFHEAVPELLEKASTELAGLTGRPVDPISTHATQGAQVVVIAMGAAVETAEAVADHLRETEKLKVGVLGIRCLRPFPEAQIVAALRGVEHAVVLERVDAPLSVDPPLARTIRACLGRAQQRQRQGTPGPAGKDKDFPNVRPVAYGLGSLPLRAADLAELLRRLPELAAERRYLGLDFVARSAQNPKRQVLLDRLQREYPGLVHLGITAPVPLELEPAGIFTVALPDNDPDLVRRAGELFQPLFGGGLRTRALHGSEARLTFSADPLRDLGDDRPIDLRVLELQVPTPEDRSVLRPEHFAGLSANGALLVVRRGTGQVECHETTPDAAHARGVSILECPAPLGDGREPVLGAILAALEQRNAPVKARRANALLQDLLKHDEGPLEPGFSLPDEAQQRIEARLQDFEAARTGLRTLEPTTSAPHPEDGPPPWIVRRIERTDPGFDSLPRFWDQVGLLYRNHQTDALSPDPYFATGTVPPLASALRGPAPDRKQLPHFEPGPCTGCGACWSVCPDGAIGPIAITPAALIESGMAIARKQGRSADALRRVGSKLASQMSARLRTDAPPESVRNLIAGAYQELVEKGTVPEDARTAMDEAAEALEWGVGGLGVSVTRPFFGDPESKKRGSGEIFSIAIDSDACQGCEACVTACEPKALLARPDSPARSMEARARWRIWEELPDPGGETMTRLRDDREFSSGAALLLSRHARLAMSGGGKAEPGSGAKLAVRYALAAAELERQPRVQRTVAAIDARKEALALQIRETMVQALPADDIEALAQGLEGIGRSADLAELAGRVERAGGKGRVNLSRLTDLVETARRLEDLRWQLQSGVNGLGRARAGLAWDPGLRSHWAVQFPDNPFAGPIVIDGSGESLSIAAGLMAGQLERAIEEATVLRHAVQLTSPDKNPAERPAIYADLLEEEKGLLAPIWLVIESEKLAGRIEPLDRALGQALPLRILAISDQLSDPFDVGLRALVQRDVFVVQSSVSHPDHLLRSLMSALASDGPALAHVLAPSPRAHGWKSDQSVPRAREAVSSLAFPLFRYDPAREGVFGSRIDLDGNTPGVPSTPAPADSGSWRVLQELAGAVTPFTGQVREEVLAEVSAKHAQELAAQKAELEQRIAETEASVRSELNAQLRRRLAELAIRGRELAEARGESR